MKKRQIALATSLLAGLLPQGAQACGDGAYIGQVCFTAASHCPLDTVEANGQLLSTQQYQVLFSLLSNTYGGDARTNFRLPDLRGRSPRGQGDGPGLTSVPMGYKGGQNETTLTIAQMPVHTHATSFTPADAFQVTASLPVSGTTGNLSALSSGAGYLAGLAGPDKITVKGYTTEAPAAGGASLLGITRVSYTGPNRMTMDKTGGVAAVSTDSPYLGPRACIVFDGIYPPHPD